GFSHTGYTASDTTTMGEIIFMPTTGEPTFNPNDYRSKYTKKTEKASPGYYKVKLDAFEISVEVAATLRAGIQAYNYPTTNKANVIIDLQNGGNNNNAYIEVINNREI